MNPSPWTVELTDAAATEQVGAVLARCVEGGLLLFLHGELGAGKTTLVRGLLRALGHAGAVKSPTYTLVEPYALGGRAVYHFDLYRLGVAEELEYLGIRDYLAADALCLVEWPERGFGVLPNPDLTLHLDYLPPGRLARFEPHTAAGAAALACLRENWSKG